ncbi:MAG: hypothetical protein K0B01_07750 [Syntrophobacterales bacterium]|nr:hypothetical protein [Syntrophobacterales bacterium]
MKNVRAEKTPPAVEAVESKTLAEPAIQFDPLFQRRLCPEGGYVTHLFCEHCPKLTTCRVWKDLRYPKSNI